MNTLRNNWAIWLIILAPYFFAALFWNDLPNQIPIHFNHNGVPDNYANKTVGVLLMPAINIVLYLLFDIFPKIDPSKKNYGLFQDKLKPVRTAIHTFFSLLMIVTFLYTLGHPINISFIVLYGLAALFLLTGNYLGNIRHNYFIGIRTPWTLANEQVWIRTHRFAAKVWVICSLLIMLILPFFDPTARSIPFIIYAALLVFLPIGYSFIQFKRADNA